MSFRFRLSKYTLWTITGNPLPLYEDAHYESAPRVYYYFPGTVHGPKTIEVASDKHTEGEFLCVTPKGLGFMTTVRFIETS